MKNVECINNKYSPMSAIVFAKMFEDNSSKKLAKNLINAVLKDIGYKEIKKVLDVKSEYTLIGTINSETGKVNKGGRLDVRAVDDDNHIYNIEVQIVSEPSMNERSIFYISKLIANTTPSGAEFSEIPKVIAINFLLHGVRKNSLRYHNVAGVIYDDSATGTIESKIYEWASDKIEIHNIEIDVFQKTQCKKNIAELSELGIYLRYMLGGYKNKKEGAELMKIAKNLIEYSEMYNVAASDPEVQRRYDFYISGVMDEASRIGHAKREAEREGRREGMRAGKLEGKLEIARQLKLEGVEYAVIAKCTELSIEEISEI